MASHTPRVTVLAPGCFAVLNDQAEGKTSPAQGQKQLEINDSRVISTDSRAYEQALAAALNQPVPALGKLPVAHCQLQVDSIAGISANTMPAHCVCAELVHFQADKDNARLIPEPALDIDEEESQQLLHALNDLIQPDGLKVHRSALGGCYLTGMPADALDTWPAHAVANGKIANYLPRQSQAGDWRRLLTEVQMLFHTHPVNEARARTQLLPINGMWFWGGARHDPPVPVSNTLLVADDAYALGLGETLTVESINTESKSWAGLLHDHVQNANINKIVIADLHVYDAWLSGNHTALQRARQRLHEQWITPIQQAVADGLVAEFVLDGCEGQAIVELQKSQSPTGLTGWLANLSTADFFLKRFFRSNKS